MANNKIYSADALSLLSATDENGNIDEVAFEAQRLILANENIGGVSAEGLMDGMLLLTAYNEDNKDVFIDAILNRLDSNSARNFREMLDKHAIREIEIDKDFLEKARQHQNRLSQWASEIARNNANNKSKERSFINRILTYLGSSFGNKHFRSRANIINPALLILSENLDLAKLAYRFNTDENYRDILIGTAMVYAADGLEDPSEPVRDYTKAAVRTWKEWEQGLEVAIKENNEVDYLARGNGAVGVEKMAMLLPISKIQKFTKRASDLMSDDITAVLAEMIAEASAQLDRRK